MGGVFVVFALGVVGCVRGAVGGYGLNIKCGKVGDETPRKYGVAVGFARWRGPGSPCVVSKTFAVGETDLTQLRGGVCLFSLGTT